MPYHDMSPCQYAYHTDRTKSFLVPFRFSTVDFIREHLTRVFLLISCIVLFEGCSSHSFQLPYRDLTQADILHTPRSAIKNGGKLTIPLKNWPSNFNYHNIDGGLYDLSVMLQATTFSAFNARDDGSLYYDHDYFTDIRQYWDHGEQKIQYTINPQARWSNGELITWKDFAQIAHINSGVDPQYMINSSNGYVDIKNIQRGVNDRQFTVTMKHPFAQWQGLFGYMYPASSLKNSAMFNTHWINTAPPSAGPFIFSSIDARTQTVIMKRNPYWWGAPAKLDTLIFKVLANSQGISPYLTGEFSSIEIDGNIADLQQAIHAPHTIVRRAYSGQLKHLDFNEAPGRITSDKQVRHAIAHAIDRKFLQIVYARALVGDNPPTINNHLLTAGEQGYRDNAGNFSYDPPRARKELERAGWKLHSDNIRYKNNQPLLLHFIARTGVSINERSVNQTIQQQLAAVGIRLIIDTVPNTDFFPRYVLRGNYDLVSFMWVNDLTPIVSARSIYSIDLRCRSDRPEYDPQQCNPQQNWGLTGNQKINHAFSHALSILDPTLFLRAVNEIDSLLWEDMGQLPLFQVPIAYAQRSDLVNWGVTASPTIVWKNIGFSS